MGHTLATLAHISDLHFGDPALDPEEHFGARVRSFWRLHPRFDGFLGHSEDALGHLLNRLTHLRTHEAAKIVTTGDVTACGAPSQFQFFRTFFLGWHMVSRTRSFGLGMPDSLDLSIPGNHDHWPGDGNVLGRPSKGLTAMWPQMPIVYPVMPLTADVDLLLCGINSDSDTGAYSFGRFFARGHFMSQLAQLARQLDTQPHNQVRAMLIHHSCSHRKSNHLEMVERESRDALNEFVARYKIAVLLSGHVHVPHIAHWSTVYGDEPPWLVTEIRCGTTTQRDTPPKSWRMTTDQAAERFAPNSMIVHRLIATDSGEIQWTATVEVRTEGGFVAVPRIDWPTDRRIRVWPRQQSASLRDQ